MEAKHKKFLNKIQLITTNLKGQIIASDANVFPSWTVNENIKDVHPFFEIITPLIEQASIQEKEFSFPCVHLAEKDDLEKICDVNITFELSEIQIIIFDYSNSYYELNAISQERNESIIKAQELEFTNKFLVEKERFKNNFISNINHELTTPLTSIKGFIELLQKTELDYEQEEIVRVIKSESEHLQAIFTDMLDISRIESGQFKLTKEDFDLKALVQNIEESFKKIASEKLLDFEVNYDSKINSIVFSDKTRIYQIITNLLNNAFKYTSEGKVTLSLNKISGKNRKQEIVIKVKDTGVGISPEDKELIFEAFSQLNDLVDGSGLGLHVTKSLIFLMSGTIDLKSELGKGAEFTVTLKLQNSKGQEKQGFDKEYKLEKGKKYRILIVENRQNTQYLLMKQLLSKGIFFVDAVENAENAIKSIEFRNYDLIILDIKLPEMSGFELTKVIRTKYGDSSIKDIPIVGISGITTPNIEGNALSSGMDAFIPKPFSEEILMKKVVRLLALKKN